VTLIVEVVWGYLVLVLLYTLELVSWVIGNIT